MAKFIRIHDEFDREIIVNLEHVMTIEPVDKYIYLLDCEGITISRQSEWNKVMKFVNENEEV